MRGQRATLSGFWVWLAMAALLLGGLPALHGRSGEHPVAASLQQPLEERGGEGSAHEQGPAKLRRSAAPPARTLPAPPPCAPALLALDLLLESFPVTLAAPLPGNDGLQTASHPRWAERPGRRVQRGQAPPRA